MIDALLDRDLVPDAVVRPASAASSPARLREQEAGGSEAQARRFGALLEWLRTQPIAVATDAANAQHYEVPPPFFERVLGPHLKYSSAWWPPGVAIAGRCRERRCSQLTTERAQIADGQRILELGCGWGSLTLHLARRFPSSSIIAVSNSAPQREYIAAKARALRARQRRGRHGRHQRLRTRRSASIASSRSRCSSTSGTIARLFARIRHWLTDDGRFFAHVFAHRHFAYPYEAHGESDWMARHFFTGGMMPSHDLFLHCRTI